MKVTNSNIPAVLIIEPDIYYDSRGLFMETWSKDIYKQLGVPEHFVQDNLSYSRKGVLRGLHYQEPKPQGKLVTAIQGEVFDVAVDIRIGSPTFGQWVGVVLSEKNHKQVYIPEGFAHGFCVLSEDAYLYYKCTEFYTPQTECGIRWDDPEIAISWPVEDCIISDKDAKYPFLKEVT